MSITTSSFHNLLSRSMTRKSNLNPTLSKSNYSNNDNAENTPPLCSPNTIQIDEDHNRVSTKSVTFDTTPIAPHKSIAVIDKRESSGSEEESDPSVKVVVRIRSVNEHGRFVDRAVKKLSSDSLSVEDRQFTFDSVFDSDSNQEEIFQSVGIPLVKDALAGYNASILSYGQTGTGKTYTMWGPPSAMVDDPSPTSQQGIVPRIFQMFFSEIEKEKMNSDGKINYQCRCSFLEIYNEQIGDLLDPGQRNLEIKDDTKSGLYVENLTEEYVTSYEDITQMLIKGLSSRKVGATSTNSKSSRSHIVFTFVIESWCKGSSSNCFGSSRSSRISFVDLAGMDRNKLDDASGLRVREGKYVKKSISQLGHLVNTLAKGTQPGKAKDSLYRGSRLTHLLRESLGGNAKLTVICAIAPDNKNNSEILSTLRFGERVKLITNEPVINEISADDVDDLSDQIRQLKEELIRAKSDACYIDGNRSGYFKGVNVRDSLNQLRVSLNRSLMLSMDDDFEKDVNVDEKDIRELRQQLDNWEKDLEVQPDNRDSIQFSAVDESCESEYMSDEEVNYPEEIELERLENKLRNSISIDTCHRQPSSILDEPLLSESPKIGNTQRKSMVLSSSLLGSQSNLPKNSISNALRESIRQSEANHSSLRSSKVLLPTESLAGSLQRGLQIIDNHQQNSTSIRSSVAFSFEHLMLQPCPQADKANASIQTLPEERPFDGSVKLCASCQQTIDNNSNDLPMVPVYESENSSKSTDKVSQDHECDLMEASNKVKELEKVCMEQAAKIEQLNHLVEQYKSEKIQSISNHGQEIVPFEKPIAEYKLPETSNEKCEIKEVQEVYGHEYGNTSFDANEKEILLNEIQSLRTRLQLQTESSSLNKSTDKLRSSLLSRSIQLRKSINCGNATSLEELEKERERWTEMESEWICLTDELRMDIEIHRQRAEKVENDLRLEKKITEELDDVISRSIVGQVRMVEHYTELQEKYNELVGKHRAIMEGVSEIKKAAAKAGKKGQAKFAKAMAAELSAVRVEREREREHLKKENRSLKIQLRDTAEAVHAAGELLVRLREAEEAAMAAEENFNRVREDNEKLRKQVDKIKRKHKMEMITMKQYMAGSKLPESALQPLYREDSETMQSNNLPYDDDQAWRTEFGAIYQDHY
ncbi:hypothetical protein ACFE04_022528 [Oxalis oulophora]